MTRATASIPLRYLFLIAVSACAGEPPPLVTGSQAASSMMARSNGATVVVHPDEGVVSWLLADGSFEEVQTNGRPTRVAFAGKLAFVTLRGARQVVVLRRGTDQINEVARIDVGAEPFGVVASPNGDAVYVSVALESKVVEIDVATLRVTRSFDVTGEPRWLALHPAGRLYAFSAYNGDISSVDLNTGEVSFAQITPSYACRGVPSLCGMRTTGDPALSPDGQMLVVPATGTNGTVGYYGDGAELVFFEFSDRSARLNKAAHLTGSIGESNYLSSIAFSADGATLYATEETADRVLAITEFLSSAGMFVSGRATESWIAVPVRGPTALRSDEDGVRVFGFLGRQSTRLGSESEMAQYSRPTSRTRLASDIELGRDLFYRSRDERLATTVEDMSCSSCHFDGRSDGVTWTALMVAGQTPSLAGPVSSKAPLRWTGDRSSIQDDARQAIERLEGTGLTEEELDALAAYVDFIPAVQTPHVDEVTRRRGREVFERVGCDGCHAGPLLTDRRGQARYEEVLTPSLLGLAGSPPYFRDGSARNLAEAIQLHPVGADDMPQLSAADTSDLIEYLRSL